MAKAKKKAKHRTGKVSPHRKLRKRCTHCGTFHTKSEHWSHKAHHAKKYYGQIRKDGRIVRPIKPHRRRVKHATLAGEAAFQHAAARGALKRSAAKRKASAKRRKHAHKHAAAHEHEVRSHLAHNPHSKKQHRVKAHKAKDPHHPRKSKKTRSPAQIAATKRMLAARRRKG